VLKGLAIYVNVWWSNVGIYQGGRHAARRKRKGIGVCKGV
jgi:hypothetical protein